MKILPVTDPSFRNYGQILEGYDTAELLAVLDRVTPLPEGTDYVPEQPELMALPIAEELGLPFTVKELRAYETRMKLSRIKPAGIPEEGEEIEDPFHYWLLDYGWEENDEAVRRFRESRG